MLVDDNNRYHIAQWCNGIIARDGYPGLTVPSKNGSIKAMPGDLIMKNGNDFFVFTPKIIIK